MPMLRWPIRERTPEELEIGLFAPTPPLPSGSKTFAEWKAEGMRIAKDSKSVGRNKEGVAVFAPHQVYKPRIWMGDEDLYGFDPDDDGDDFWRDFADACDGGF